MTRIRDSDNVEEQVIAIIERQALALERIAAALEKPLKAEVLK